MMVIPHIKPQSEGGYRKMNKNDKTQDNNKPVKIDLFLRIITI